MASITTTFTNFSYEIRGGAIGSTWQNPSNAQSEDGSIASYSTPSGSSPTSGFSNFLICSNTASKVPLSSTIDGLLLRIKKSKYNSTPFTLNVYDESVFFDYSGSQSENKAKTGENYPLTLTFSSYGSETDKWSLNPSVEMVNSSDFKLKFAIDYNETHPATIATGNVDVFELTIYYTPDAPPAEPKSRVFLIT